MSNLAQYNATKRETVQQRRTQVEELLKQYGLYHGVQQRIAKELGISKDIVSRDIQTLRPRIVLLITPLIA